MFCKICGRMIAENALFCTFCGTPVAENSPQPTDTLTPAETILPEPDQTVSTTPIADASVSPTADTSAPTTDSTHIVEPIAPASVPVAASVPLQQNSAVTQGSSFEYSLEPPVPKPKEQKYYTLGHIVMCLAAVGVMAIIAGIFAGLYFSVI